MNITQYQDRLNISSETLLIKGNVSLRNKKYEQAIGLYIEALIQRPELIKIILGNLAYARYKWIQIKSNIVEAPKIRIAVVGSKATNISPDFSRHKILAQILKSVSDDISLVYCIDSEQPQDIIPSDIKNQVRLLQIIDNNVIDSCIQFVIAHPYDQLFLSNPSSSSVFLGFIYKIIWNTQIVVDVSESIPVFTLNENPILRAFDQISVSSLTLQNRHGGILFSEESDFEKLFQKSTINPLLNPILDDFGRKIGGYIATLTQLAEICTLSSIQLCVYKAINQPFMDKIIDLIHRLGYEQTLDNDSFFESICNVNTAIEFIQVVYKYVLGRQPQEHEIIYFSELFTNKAAGRYEIIELVLDSEECKRHMADLSLGKNIAFIKKKFRLPSLGDISPEAVVLPYYEEPEVSVLIPVYGKLEYTLHCLKSIADNLPKISFEVIILDDQSPDDSVQILRKIPNLGVLVNHVNLGFLRSCNHGATQARGKYLMFLNNDTEVKKGWLDELRRTFDVFLGTGLVGSKLLYPDGTLQEAGGIIWNDGSAWNFGNKQNPNLPIYNYAREVDYVSGAALMISASLFNEVGGFDEIYVPAYCEDSDLALKIRDIGYRIIYQPTSEIIHFEGATSGTDTSKGVKAYQVKNSVTLFQRWRHRLSTHGANGERPDLEKDRCVKLRVLVLEHCTPTPNQDAGSVSVFNLLLLLREMGFQITFIPEDNFLYISPYTEMLQSCGIEVLYAPFITSVQQHVKDDGSRYDLVFLFRPLVVERHIETIRQYCPQAKILFYTHDIHHIRMFREAELLNSIEKRREAEKMKVREMEAIKAVDSTIIVSTVELELLQPQLPNVRLELLPLLLDIPGAKNDFYVRSGLLFIGGFQHGPNVDAVKYFVNDIMPILRERIPGIIFNIVGSNPPEEVMELASADVVIHGFIDDLTSILESTRISVAPLRFGAGVKGKVGSAMASGLPVVATPVAAEGMGLNNSEQLLVAETPEEIVSAIQLLYSDEALWKQISKNGIIFAEKNFGATALFEKLFDVIKRLNLKPSSMKRGLILYNYKIHMNEYHKGTNEI